MKTINGFEVERKVKIFQAGYVSGFNSWEFYSMGVTLEDAEKRLDEKVKKEGILVNPVRYHTTYFLADSYGEWGL